MTLALQDVAVDEITRATGISKEVLRKWEMRYGFPIPERNSRGDRIYPADQVSRLRFIRRLLDAGMRPGQVVALDESSLTQRLDGLRVVGSDDSEAQEVLDALTAHDVVRMRALLNKMQERHGLADFVKKKLVTLNTLVGDAWLSGRIRIFEEHLYSKTVRDLLQGTLPGLENGGSWPTVLLTTPPGELHTLGLTMAQTVLAQEGAFCLSLDAQTPVSEILAAVKAMRTDIVGLSFSIAYPAKETQRYLKELRAKLDPSVSIWAGGGGAARLSRRPTGVVYFSDLDGMCRELARYRERQGVCLSAAS